MQLSRRDLVAGGSVAALLTLSACGVDSGSMAVAAAESPVKTAAARAIATLSGTTSLAGTAAKVTLPSQMAGQSGGSVVSILMNDTGYRATLIAAANAVASAAVPVARPIIEAAAATAAAETGSETNPYPGTKALQTATRSALFPAVSAAIEARMTGAEAGLFDEALAQVIGIDRAGLVADLADRTVSGLFAAIAIEEAKIQGFPLAA